MKGYWDHKGKPSMFVVKDGDKEIYRGGFKKGYELLMNTEPKNETIEYLRKYNEWRRGAETEQPDPKELGEQIDAAIGAMVMLEETAKLAATLREERDEAREDLEFRRGLYKIQEQYLEAARRERDEAKAALENNRKATEMLERMVYEEREKNAKLRDISERAINALTAAWGYAEATKMLRADLDQLKEGGE